MRELVISRRSWRRPSCAKANNSLAARGGAPCGGAVLRTFKHTDTVWCLALLPDGCRFVGGSGDKTARIVEHGLAPQKPQ